MTVCECYEKIDADYDEVIGRLMSEQLILKYLKRFCASGHVEDLKSYIAEQHYEDAFRTAHIIKGICLNLALTRLYDCSFALCEALRTNPQIKEIPDLLEALLVEVQRVTSCVSEIDEQ